MALQNIPNIKHADSNNFFLLCGPCAIEGEDMALRIAEKVISKMKIISVNLEELNLLIDKDLYKYDKIN